MFVNGVKFMMHLDVKSWMDLHNIRIQNKIMNTNRNTNHNAK